MLQMGREAILSSSESFHFYPPACTAPSDHHTVDSSSGGLICWDLRPSSFKKLHAFKWRVCANSRIRRFTKLNLCKSFQAWGVNPDRKCPTCPAVLASTIYPISLSAQNVLSCSTSLPPLWELLALRGATITTATPRALSYLCSEALVKPI